MRLAKGVNRTRDFCSTLLKSPLNALYFVKKYSERTGLTERNITMGRTRSTNAGKSDCTKRSRIRESRANEKFKQFDTSGSAFITVTDSSPGM